MHNQNYSLKIECLQFAKAKHTGTVRQYKHNYTAISTQERNWTEYNMHY